MARKSVSLTLRNPSPYPREGVVVRAWQPVAKRLDTNATSARVFRVGPGGGRNPELLPLPAQVDVLDPGDPERTQLVFALDTLIADGRDDYSSSSGIVRVEADTADEQAGTAVAEQFYSGAKLRNEHFELWINTGKKRDEGEPGDFYAGSVTSVELLTHSIDHPLLRHNRLDALDANNWFDWDRHPEQRAMQIDRIHLIRPAWDERASFEAFPYRDHWRVLRISQGPVRATVTIASAPFEFPCRDADGDERMFHCTVYRAISLYSGERFVGDEIWVKAVDAKSGLAQRIWFVVGYFMMANFTSDKEIFRYPDHPGWFTIHTEVNEPRQGYAFATDSRATALWTPPLDYPHRGLHHRAFSWEVGPTRVAHSFHAFRVQTSRHQLTDLAGMMWYRLAFKRIRATLETEK
ncbi:MAG TPA: hypothetical protein VNI54_03655 [Thermoanaerobaculia bacterium]|nr:hypothetical protein [Thermoanaerobaculia bacterium]